MPKQPENTPMEPEHAKFDEIINTVSPDEMRNPPPSEERGKNIAVFARFIANAHPGWPSFPEEIRDRFRREIENLYNRNGNGPENLLKEMEKTLIRSIPDNHAFILNPDKSRALDENESAAVNGKIIDKAPTPETGDNSAYSLAETPACKTLFRSGTEDFPLAIFEKRDRSGNKIGIVSLTKCPPPGDEKYNSEALKKVFADNYGKWNAVVLDVRGNEGGNADVINFVNEKLCGSPPRYFRRQEMRTTPEAKILQEQKYNRAFLDRLHAQNPEGYKSPEFTEPDFSAGQGYDGNIYVLTDRRTGSSAEFVSGLRRHPKVKYVGENTHGCGEYGDTATALLPNGGYLNMGIYKNELFAGIREGEGLAPTHRTPPGRDAFDHCMQLMQYDFARERVSSRLPPHAKSVRPAERTNISGGRLKDGYLR